MPIVHQLLSELNLVGIVERFCGDDGDVGAGKVVEALVHSRLDSLSPVPLSRFEEWVRKTVLPHLLEAPSEKLNEYRLGRVLATVGTTAQSMWLELVANAHRLYGLDLEYSVYDTTSFHFEGEYEQSELLRYGYSRDGKPGTKQVNAGLNVSGTYGVPLLYSVLPGSSSDTLTVPTNLEQLQRLYEFLGVGRSPIVVGDRAMLNVELIQVYHRAGAHYIGSMPASKAGETLIRSVSPEMLQASPMDYRPQRLQGAAKSRLEDEKYYAVRVEVTIPAVKEVVGSTPLRQWALVVQASGKRKLDSQKRETLLRKTEERLAEIARSLNLRRYGKKHYAESQVQSALAKYPAVRGMLDADVTGEDGTLSLTWTRIEGAIHAAAFLDGKYVVYFSHEEWSDDEVFGRFKSRDVVERRVGNLKGPVVVRPVYLHNDDRIRGLIFGSMVALLVYAIAEMRLRRQGIQLTGEGVGKMFEGFGGSLLTFSDRSQVVTLPTGNRWQRQILNHLGVPMVPATPVLLPDAYTRFSDATAAVPQPWPTRGGDTGRGPP